MLNRLYIVIGVVIIIALAAAFVVPHLVPWTNYRGRMETLASQSLGTPVAIKGDIAFSLLPAPHLVLHEIEVGPPDKPVLSAGSASADFSLIDFLRDRYTMTRLVLRQPALDVTVGSDGHIDTGMKLAGAQSRVALSVQQAQIEDGTLRVIDARAGRTYTVDDLAGDLTVGALRGPFGFSGSGQVAGQHLSLRVNASALDAAGNTQVTAFAQPPDKGYSLNLTGALATAAVPHFTGELDYRHAPPANNPNDVIGSLTFATKLDMTPAKALLSAFTLVPDENRGATRLAGSATVDLGAHPHFTASLTSSVLSTPPPDVTKDQGPEPYEFARLLRALPALPVPPIPGELTAEADEIDLDRLSLANASLDATTDGKTWAVKTFAAQLPGGTNLQLAGTITAPRGRTSFDGTLAIRSRRLDALAGLWRKPPPDNPLFNMPGALTGKVSLSGGTLGITDGVFTLDKTAAQFSVLAALGAHPNLTVSAQFGTLSAADSTALLALLPDVANDPSAALTFPNGAISLTAKTASLFGLAGRNLDLEGNWGNGAISISQLSADDFGGAKFNVALNLRGTLAKPRLSGGGAVSMGQTGGPALTRLFDWLGTPATVRGLVARSLPMTFKARLDDPDNGGGQGLSLTGKAGVADVTFLAQLNGGLLGALKAPVDATISMQSQDAAALSAQLGLGDVSILAGDGPLTVAARASGDPAGTMTTSVDLERGKDAIDFAGKLTPGGLTAIAGTGTLKLALSDSTALAADLGLDGLYTPPFTASADLTMTADGRLSLDKIDGAAGGDGFSGRLGLARDPRGATVSGALKVDHLDVAALVAGMASPTALMASSGNLWPDGPLSLGDAPRPTTGSVAISTGRITRGGTPFLTDASFNVDWDATHAGIQGLSAKLGQGQLTLDANLCCAGPLAAKQLGGQAALSGVALNDLLPPATAATLSGTLAGSARFSATGDSIAALLGSLSGDGSFEVDNLAVQKFDPGAFAAIAALKDILDMSESDLSAHVATAVDQGPFSVPKLSGALTIAGGRVQVANVGAEAGGAKLFGGVSVKLADLGLSGSVALSPVKTLDEAGLVGPTTSSVTANLSGTLLEPKRTLDIASMVETIKVHALENEVARLEKLKAQQDAEAKSAAIAAKEAVEDQARRQLEAQQAAAKAAADAAAKQAAADEKAAADAKAAADEKAAADAKVAADEKAAAATADSFAAPAAARGAAPSNANPPASANPPVSARPPPLPNPPPVPAPRPSPDAAVPAPSKTTLKPLDLELPPIQYQLLN